MLNNCRTCSPSAVELRPGQSYAMTSAGRYASEDSGKVKREKEKNLVLITKIDIRDGKSRLSQTIQTPFLAKNDKVKNDKKSAI